jgi:DNA-binding NtrC family response regulator
LSAHIRFRPPHVRGFREGKGHIPLLVKHFCQKYEAKIGKKITNISQKVMDALAKYDWPGNIRELENIIERALILSRGNTLDYGDGFPPKKNKTKKFLLQRLKTKSGNILMHLKKLPGK